MASSFVPGTLQYLIVILASCSHCTCNLCWSLITKQSDNATKLSFKLSSISHFCPFPGRTRPKPVSTVCAWAVLKWEVLLKGGSKVRSLSELGEKGRLFAVDTTARGPLLSLNDQNPYNLGWMLVSLSLMIPSSSSYSYHRPVWRAVQTALLEPMPCCSFSCYCRRRPPLHQTRRSRYGLIHSISVRKKEQIQPYSQVVKLLLET